MKQQRQSSRAGSKSPATTARKQVRSLGARKTTGKRVTKSGDSGKGTTRKSDIPKPERAPKPQLVTCLAVARRGVGLPGWRRRHGSHRIESEIADPS